MRGSISLLVLPLALFACSSGDPVSFNGTTASGDGGGAACTAGQQIACLCQDGAQGVQFCKADGSSYGPCECGGAGGGGNASGGAGGGSASGGAGGGAVIYTVLGDFVGGAAYGKAGTYELRGSLRAYAVQEGTSDGYVLRGRFGGCPAPC